MTLYKRPDNCDVIVLGGGDNGLLCASYLAKAGAKTLLLQRETRCDIAGNLNTGEFQGPYRFNLLPPYMVMLGARAPCHSDLQLAKQSLAYITPPVQLAFHHNDGRALVFHLDPKKSATSIARFCAADAQRFLALHAEFHQLCEEILIPSLYAPDGSTEVAAQLGATDLGKRLAYLSAKTPIAIVDSYGFECPQVREAILYLATFWGLDPWQAGVGHLVVLWVYCLMNSSLVKSGNLAAANALYHSFLENGGDCPLDVGVERILMENKKAVGVRLNDGREIRARAVVSTLDIEQTFLELVGEDKLPDSLAKACHAWEWQQSSLLGCHFGYKGEAPSYHSAEFDSDANQAYIHVFGVEQAGDVAAIHQTISKGEVPMGHGRAICATQFDEFHAGFAHVGGPLQTLRFEVPVPNRLKDRAWKDAHAACQKAALETWRRYANNVVDETLSYSRVVTPHELQRCLPSFKQGSFAGGNYSSDRMGYAGTQAASISYRSEIPGLYMGGASTQSGGLIHFAAGYNAAGIVARDLNLSQLWEEPANVRAARKNGYLPETA